MVIVPIKETPLDARKLDGISYGRFQRFLESDAILRTLGIVTDYSEISPHVPSADRVIPISKDYMFIYLDKPEERAIYGIQRDMALDAVRRLERHHDTCNLEGKEREVCVDCVDNLIEQFQDAGERLSHRKRSSDDRETYLEKRRDDKLAKITRKRERIGKDYEDGALYVGPAGTVFALVYAITKDLAFATAAAAAVETPSIILARNLTERREEKLDVKEDKAWNKWEEDITKVYSDTAFDFARVYLQTLAPWAREVSIRYPKGIEYTPQFEKNLEKLCEEIEQEKKILSRERERKTKISMPTVL